MKITVWSSISLALLAGALGAPAFAAKDAGSFDVYYVPSAKLKNESGGSTSNSDGGSGFGVKGQFPVDRSVFLLGEYQANSYDGFDGFKADTNLDTLRLGVGFKHPSGLFVSGEYIKAKFKIDAPAPFGTDESNSGYGVHGGVMADLSPQFNFSADIGYLDLGNDGGNGLEFRVGGAFALSNQYGIFADYRQSELKDNSNNKNTLSDVRVGFRVNL